MKFDIVRCSASFSAVLKAVGGNADFDSRNVSVLLAALSENMPIAVRCRPQTQLSVTV